MRQSVIELERFYSSPLGAMAQAKIARRLTALWPQYEELSGIDMLGYGYGGPYLTPYVKPARSVVLAMPKAQGAMTVTSRRGNMSCLVDEDSLPFPPASFDRIFLAHGLEESENPARLLAELWRVIKPEGQLVVLAPNRTGLWARSDASPFGAGRPFSRGQLKSILIGANFLPVAWSGALYGPPMPALKGLSGGFERFGETVWPRFSGIILVQAIKRLYAHSDKGAAIKARLPKFVGVAPMGARIHEES